MRSPISPALLTSMSPASCTVVGPGAFGAGRGHRGALPSPSSTEESSSVAVGP